MSNAQIAERLGRAPATIKGYFYDPSYADKRPTQASARRAPCTRPPAPGLRSQGHQMQLRDDGVLPAASEQTLSRVAQIWFLKPGHWFGCG